MMVPCTAFERFHRIWLHEKKENWYQSNLCIAFAAGPPFKARPAAFIIAV